MADYQSSIFLEGLCFTEGPRWHADRLWFSDIFGQKVYSVAAEGNDLRIEAEVPGRPSGLGWLPDGRLLIVSMRDCRLLRREYDGTLTTVAELRSYCRGDTNDMVVDKQGRAYIGSWGFDFIAGETMQPGRMVMVEPDGKVRHVGEEMSLPNGCFITPDEQRLIVAEHHPPFHRDPGGRLTAYSIEPDGSLTNRRTFAEWVDYGPDGICLDQEGAVWIGTALRHEFLRVKEGGEILDRIATPGKHAVACALGGADLRTLYLCTSVVEHDDWPKGKAVAWIEACRVGVPGVPPL